MAGISSTLSKSDLKFMAEDIGRELLAFLPAEDRVAGMSVEERLTGITVEELLTEMSPEKRKHILELLLKMNAKSTGKKSSRSSGSRSNGS